MNALWHGPDTEGTVIPLRRGPARIVDVWHWNMELHVNGCPEISVPRRSGWQDVTQSFGH